ncbi:nuclear pore protein 84/107 [Zopfochytrium polystomum]|nr:nuclear pore protein 84/107 [Zopfochytrium polystomum]
MFHFGEGAAARYAANRGTDDGEATLVVAASGDNYLIGTDHEEFAAALRDTPEDDLLMEDGVISKYIAVCEERLDEEEYGEDGTDLTEREHWRLESATWKLIGTLLDIRLDALEEDTGDIHIFSSDLARVQHWIGKSKTLSELVRVKEWLEETAPPVLPVEVRKGYWPYTCRQAREALVGFSKPSGVSKFELDPDGPIRNRQPLAPDDKNYELGLNQTIFDYVRRGRLEDAMNLCRVCDHPWKAASLGGALYSNDALIDGNMEGDSIAGNVNRDLWRAVCFAIANDDSFDPYERAVYAVLSGDVKNALPVCTSWEDQVWAHIYALVEQKLSECLASDEQINASAEISDLPLPSENIKLEEVFEKLVQSSERNLHDAAQNPFRLIQAFWVMDIVDSMFENFHMKLEAKQSISNMPQVLRFLAHLFLVLRKAGYQMRNIESGNFILRSYVDLLILARKPSAVTTFTVELPAELQIHCHAQFFKSLGEDRDVRLKYLEEAKKRNLNTREICLETAEALMQGGVVREHNPSSAQSVILSNLDSPVMDSERTQILGLEWVLFDKSQRVEALGLWNKLSRRFLVFGRVNCVKELLGMLPTDMPPQDLIQQALNLTQYEETNNEAAISGMDPFIKSRAVQVWEFFAYKALILALEGYGKFCVVLSQRPLSGRETFQFKDWLEALKVAKDSAVEYVEQLLLPKNWLTRNTRPNMSAQEIEQARDFQFLREVYLPEAVMMLHRIYYDTREYIPGHLEKSAQLIDMISQSEDKLYSDLMRSGKAAQVLTAIQRAKAELAGRTRKE